MKKVLKGLWSFVEAVIIVYVIFVTSCILCRNDYGYTQFGKYTFVTINESNQKFFTKKDVGDLLVIKNQQFNIEPGDVIYYYLSVDEEYIVREGIVENKTEDDYSALYVLRDADRTSVSSKRVIGKYVSILSGWGSLLEVLESRLGFLFLVLLPIMIVFIYQVYQLVVVARYENVDEDDDDDKDRPKEKEKVKPKKAEEKDIELL